MLKPFHHIPFEHKEMRLGEDVVFASNDAMWTWRRDHPDVSFNDADEHWFSVERDRCMSKVPMRIIQKMWKHTSPDVEWGRWTQVLPGLWQSTAFPTHGYKIHDDGDIRNDVFETLMLI